MFSDLLVIELASVLAGPSVGQFFAELGATVIKVENPRTGGDVTRRWTAPGEELEDDRSAYFCCCNHGKKSVALDLSTDRGRHALHRLVAPADVVLTSFRPGTAASLGADASTLRSLNDRLVVGKITGYGPDDDRAGYDAVIQAESGFTYMNGSPDGPPTKLPVALMDVLAAHQLKEGLLVKLLQRERTGTGGVVTVSLLQAAVSALVNQATNYLVAGHVPERMGSAHPNIAPYGTLYPTADDTPIVLAVGTDRQFASLCGVLGLDDLPHDPDYATNADRVAHREALDWILQSCIERVDAQALLDALHEKNVPAGAVRRMPEVFNDRHAAAMTLGTAPDASFPAGLRQVAFSEPDDAANLLPPPHYGEHTRDILHTYLDTPVEEVEAIMKDADIG